MHQENTEIDKIVSLLNSEDHENVWLGFQFMEAMGLTKRVISKYARLNNIDIFRDDNVLTAKGQINEKVKNLLAKLSINAVSYYSKRVNKKVFKYTYSFLGMITESENKNYLKDNSVNFSLEVKGEFVYIFLNCAFKKCKDIEVRKPILEKIPNMSTYKEDSVSCLLKSMNDSEYSFEFSSKIKIQD